MDIEIRKNGRKWIAEVWDDPIQKLSGIDSHNTYPEETYVEINKWCIDTLGYHARTAYHIFEFRKRSHLDWFTLRWT